MSLELAILLPPGLDRTRREYVATLVGRLGFLAVHLPAETELERDELEALMECAAPAMVVVDEGSDVVGIVRSNDPAEVRQAREYMDSLEDHRPLVVAVPMSIGRTRNEAVARADREPAFSGSNHPAESGIFGSLEEAQEQVLALSEAGAEILLLSIPDETDIADVLAQVRSLTVPLAR